MAKYRVGINVTELHTYYWDIDTLNPRLAAEIGLENYNHSKEPDTDDFFDWWQEGSIFVTQGDTVRRYSTDGTFREVNY